MGYECNQFYINAFSIVERCELQVNRGNLTADFHCKRNASDAGNRWGGWTLGTEKLLSFQCYTGKVVVLE